MKTQFISFHCDTDASGYYAKAAENLKAQCAAFGMPLDVRAVSSQGSWIGNTRLKSAFILELLNEYKKPVVWLDVDSDLRKPLTVFDTIDCDVAAARYSQDRDFLHGYHVRIGVLYFNYTPAATRFLETWIKLCKAGNDNPKAGKVPSAHPLFASVWRSARDRGWARLHVLPPTYSSNALLEDTVIHVGLSETASKASWQKNAKQGDLLIL